MPVGASPVFSKLANARSAFRFQVSGFSSPLFHLTPPCPPASILANLGSWLQTTTVKAIADITRECLELPSSQRLKLARILLDVSDPDQDFSPEVAGAWEDEIGARVAAVINGTARSKPIAEVFDALDQRHPA